MHSRIIKTLITFFVAMVCCAISVYGAEITDNVEFIGIDKAAVTDNKLLTHTVVNEFTISSAEPMYALYIEYNKAPTLGTINTTTYVAEHGFLHEYIELNGETSVTLTYNNADICDMRVFGEGELPSDIERWETAPGGVDILLLATHSDDDQLFFAGLLPTYTSRENVRVAVAYFINHYDTYNRTHELLRGLWHCGVRIYPEISPFPDGYSESIEGAENHLNSQGVTHYDITMYHKLLLDKYQPQVVVLHDFNGEYGHGAHMLATNSFIETIDACLNSPVRKVYVHLYEENPIVLDIDTPLDAFDGKSAFQVSQEAFRFHESQHWTWFYSWIYGKSENITLSSQIRSYNPAFYGLYYTSVGNDTGLNDMLENITPYKEQIEEIELPVEPAVPEEPPEISEPVSDETVEQENNKEIPVFVYIPAILIVLAIILSPKRKKK